MRQLLDSPFYARQRNFVAGEDRGGVWNNHQLSSIGCKVIIPTHWGSFIYRTDGIPMSITPLPWTPPTFAMDDMQTLQYMRAN